MRKHYLLTWLTIVSSLLFLSWCDTSRIQWQIEYSDEDKEIISILEKFAEEQNITSPIQKEVLTRSDSNNEKSYDVNWYTITWGSVNPKDTITTYEFFDWWRVDYLGDEIFWSRTEYSNNDIFCYYWLTLEQQPPYELLAWEDEEWNEIDYEKAWEEFYKIATYTTELSCWKIPEWAVKLSSLNINAEGQEPFWFTPIRWWKITLYDMYWLYYYYPDVLTKNGDDIYLSWYHLSWTLKKSECVDLWKWDTHEYTVSFNFETDDEGTLYYDWCADTVEVDFTEWEEWSLKNFIKKTNYDYRQPYKIEDAWYIISEIVNKYMQVDVFVNEDNWDYHRYQIIMEKTVDWWKVLFEWDWYEISDEKCEELNQYDNYLMDMFFLTSCPRG